MLEITNRHRKNGNLKLSSEAFCWSPVHPWWHSMLQYWKPRTENAQRGEEDFGRRSWLRFLVPWVVILSFFVHVHFTRSFWEEDVVSSACHLGDDVSCLYHLSQRCHPTLARIWRWPSLPLATRAMKARTISHGKQFCVCCRCLCPATLQVLYSRKKKTCKQEEGLERETGALVGSRWFNLFDLLKGFWDVPNTVDPNGTPNKSRIDSCLLVFHFWATSKFISLPLCGVWFEGILIGPQFCSGRVISPVSPSKLARSRSGSSL